MPADKSLAYVLCGEPSEDRPALVLLHFLGGSLREWDEVVAVLGDSFQTLALDLPGFGSSAAITGYTVAEMADAVQATIAAAGLSRYVLVGHSMGGKVAAVIARRMEDSQSAALAGLILVAGSPPGPEPMEDAKRAAMIDGLGERIDALGEEHPDDSVRARAYISKNELRDIPKLVEDRAVAEVLRMNRCAWTAWLTSGSREDWRQRIGILNTQALLIAGELDAALGPEGQRRESMPHLGNVQLIVLEACSHLAPLEQPVHLAAAMRVFIDNLGSGPGSLPEQYGELLHSDRVSSATRSVLNARMHPQHVAAPPLDAQQQRTLRAALDRVLPQPKANAVDIASTILARLASGNNDGWRYAVLPDDLNAYRVMLDQLSAAGFAELTASEQDASLSRLMSDPSSPAARWFEELRADAVEAWAAHPQTMSMLGFSGPGVGGADTPHRGFVELRANQRESWEPTAVGNSAEGVG
jgi:pimeloyl-ACP methyl ester carboxylesterase